MSSTNRDVRIEVLAVGRAWTTSQYRLVHLLVTLDRSGDWALDGARTCAHWVASALDIEVSTAREWLRIGRSLEKLPAVDEAFREGRISFSKVRQLTRVANADNEADLLAIAERTTAGRLGSELARWLAGHEEPDETDRRQRAARGLTWRTEPDGMVHGSIRLAPGSAAVVMAAIDAWVMRNGVSGSMATAEGGVGAAAGACPPPPGGEWCAV